MKKLSGLGNIVWRIERATKTDVFCLLACCNDNIFKCMHLCMNRLSPGHGDNTKMRNLMQKKLEEEARENGEDMPSSGGMPGFVLCYDFTITTYCLIVW